MRNLWDSINPTVRGLAIVALVALVVVALQLYQTLIAIGMLLRIAFFIAIAVVLYMLWRDRLRGDIETWSTRAKAVFYGGAALILVNLGAFFWPGRTTDGPDALAFLTVLVLAGFSMYRVWRDERAYGI
jgi:hypothetical protein